MHRSLFVSLLVAGMLFVGAATRAQDATDSRDEVIARIGSTRSITVREMQERILDLPLFQRATFGATADAIRHRFLNEVLVPEALLALGGDARELAGQPLTAYEIDRARSSAMLRFLRQRIGPAAAISAQDVQKYYDDNRARYDTPERYQIWRILCRTREEAELVLERVKKDPTPKVFGELARDQSLDKATRLRDGNLGFLTADGSSSEPGFRVAPSIVRAAQTVRDGDLVPTPVPEGEYFSIVWRRGTIAANKHPVEAVSAQIRDAIWKGRLKQETDALLVHLRADKLHDFNPGLLDTVTVPLTAPAEARVRDR